MMVGKLVLAGFPDGLVVVGASVPWEGPKLERSLGVSDG